MAKETEHKSIRSIRNEKGKAKKLCTIQTASLAKAISEDQDCRIEMIEKTI